MAGFEAIGAVSGALKALLEDRLEASAAMPQNATIGVTLGTPRQGAERPEAVEAPRLNLFLYRITENAALKNHDRHAPPGMFGDPPLALDLHYLMTAYGSTANQSADLATVDESVAQYVLGSGMRVFHETPVIDNGYLPAELVAEDEAIKLTLEPLPLEEVSKVWTALNLSYRLSVPYLVTVVQIEPRRARREPRLVDEPPLGARPHVVPLRAPRIDEVRVLRPANGGLVERRTNWARTGDTIVLLGGDLAGERTEVHIGGRDVTASVGAVRDDRLSVAVPPDPLLEPGAHPISVRARTVLDDGTERGLAESNAAAVMIVPRITAMTTRAGGTERVIEGDRLVGDPRLSSVRIGERLIADDEYVAGERTPQRLIFAEPTDLPPGRHRVRVRANGAEAIDVHEVVVT